jgi:hypothetical protein
MATYYVSHTGNNTTGNSWANAKTTLAAGLALATADGDIVLVDHTHTGDNALGADTTYAPPTNNKNCSIIAVNTGTGAVAEMGTSAWIGSSAAARRVTVNPAGAGKLYLRGLTIRNGGTGSGRLQLAKGSGGGHLEAENCYLWQGNGFGPQGIDLGSTDNGGESFCRLVNTTFRFGESSQQIEAAGKIEMYACTISSAGTASARLFTTSTAISTGSGVYAEGCDFSHMAASPTLMHQPDGSLAYEIILVNCKIPAGAVLLRRTNNPNKASSEISLYNCASGDTHYHMAHADAMGDTIIETTIVANDGASYDGGTTKTSWKIATTANATFFTPYISPWFDKYHTGTSAITPYLEILRNDSTTAFDNDEVWGEWSYQGTSGSTMSTLISDRMAPLTTPAAQDNGVGLSGWAGESGTAWSGKLQATSSITPAEIGYLRGRVVVGLASATVYVDPTIRT